MHNLWGRTYRKRSAGNVLEEIEHLVDKYAIGEIYFEDDNLTLDRNRSCDIFKGMLDRDFNIKWSCPNGIFIETIDNVMLDLMKKTGCRALGFGIESGDKHMLKNVIDKNINLDRVVSILKKTRLLKIETSVFFVLGLPDETKKSLENTFDYARKLPVDNVIFFFATPLPGTRLNDTCRKRGLIYDETDYKNLRCENALLIPKDMSRRDFLNRVRNEKIYFYFKKALKSPSWAFEKAIERISS